MDVVKAGGDKLVEVVVSDAGVGSLSMSTAASSKFFNDSEDTGDAGWAEAEEELEDEDVDG